MTQAPHGFTHSLAVRLGRGWSFVRRHPFWLIALVPLVAALYIAALVPSTPSIENIQKLRTQQPSVVLSADGKELVVFRRANREWVKLPHIAPNVLAALLATEDHRFYEHRGLDLKRTIAAAWRTMRGDVQGGSTITQQLARNLYPAEIGREQTLTRKVREAITALKIEAVYSKEEILETYLNTVPFLYNAHGIEMAARTYFDKSADELDVLESATLVGMLKGTSYYNPVLKPERAVQRRNTVLAQMVKHKKLEPAQFAELKTRPLNLEFERQEEDLGTAPHLTQQLRRWLISWADRNGYSVYGDGLVVRTTIDSRMQAMAVEALTRQADKLQKVADSAWAKRMGAPVNKELLRSLVRESAPYKAEVAAGLSDAEALKKVQADTDFMQALWKEKTTLQAAFLAMDPANGQVRAWVGSRDYKQDQFDHVQQARRQPGSTFKPFVYGAAFEQGIGPAETFIDQAVEIRIDERTVWKPSDVHDSTGLPTTLREGLIQSKNTITAQLVQKVGPARVAQVAQAMGVRQSKLDAVPSLALGTSPVTLKEMVSAYGTIANSGAYVEPVLVTAIENRAGTVLEQFQPRAPEQGLSSTAAQTLLDVMRGVIDQGTGAAIRSRFGIQGDVAGKTGTTQDNTDGWFILMHPNVVAGAWVGFNDNRFTMGDSWGQGANNALNIVGDFFQQSLKARMVDSKAKFAAPRDQGVVNPMTRMNEWLNSVFQTAPATDPQGAVVAEPEPARNPSTAAQPATPMPTVVQPAVVAIPPGGDASPLGARSPDLQGNPERARASESAQGPGFAPAPERPARMVIRVPEAPPAERRDTAEMGAGPAPSRPDPRPEAAGGEAGFRILREVHPQDGAPPQR